MAYTPVPIVEVRIWRRAVGAVALDPGLRFYAFEYQPAFVRSGIELAPLTMPLAAASEPFVFTDLPELTYRRLPGMLADALPDDFGNTLIDAWMAREGVGKPQITSLDRLAYMGGGVMGALEFKPMRGPRPAKIDCRDRDVRAGRKRQARRAGRDRHRCACRSRDRANHPGRHVRRRRESQSRRRVESSHHRDPCGTVRRAGRDSSTG